MDVESVRDWVLIVCGILWGIVTLAVAVVFFVLQMYTRKGFRAVDRLVADKLRPALDSAHGRLGAVRDTTARLPGNPPVIEAEARPVRGGWRRGLPLPFRRRRRLPFGR